MDKILYVVEGLPLVALLVLNGLIARTALPNRLHRDLLGRRWTLTELAIVLAPGVMAMLLGVVFLQGTFWTLLCELSAVMLVSVLAIWALARRWPQLSLFRRIACVLGLYVVIALGAVAPMVASSDIRWSHLRGLLALVVLLLFVLVVSVGALLAVGGAALYFSIVAEIARSVFFSPPAAAQEPEQPETPSEPEPLPAHSDFKEPDSRSA